MNAAKHTPGPWVVEQDMNTHVIRGAEEEHMSKDSGTKFLHRGYVASTWGGQHDANARLIAVAPELFDLCSQLARLLDGLENGNSSAEYRACELARQADTLVAKVTGEQP